MPLHPGPLDLAAHVAEGRHLATQAAAGLTGADRDAVFAAYARQGAEAYAESGGDVRAFREAWQAAHETEQRASAPAHPTHSVVRAAIRDAFAPRFSLPKESDG